MVSFLSTFLICQVFLILFCFFMWQIYKIFTYMHNCNILNKNVCCRSSSNAWISAYNVVKTKQINSLEHSWNDLLKRTRGPTFTLWRLGDHYFRGSQVPLLHLWGASRRPDPTITQCLEVQNGFYVKHVALSNCSLSVNCVTRKQIFTSLLL